MGSIVADAPNSSEQVQSFAETWFEVFDSFRWQWRGIYNHDTTKLEKCLCKVFAYGPRQDPELDSEAEHNWPDGNRQKRQPRLPIESQTMGTKTSTKIQAEEKRKSRR
jgi:hypothetical protein